MALIWGLGTSAHAGVNFGIKSSPLRFLGPMEGSSRYMTSGVDSYFGAEVGANKKVVLIWGLDYGRSFYDREGESPWDGYKSKEEVTLFMPHVGVKFHFTNRERGKVSPYLYGDLFKSFTSVNFEEDDPYGPDEDFYEDLWSPWGITTAFGAEYYYTDHSSLGGEFGVRYSFTKAEGKSFYNGGAYPRKETERVGLTYTMITVNFRL